MTENTTIADEIVEPISQDADIDAGDAQNVAGEDNGKRLGKHELLVAEGDAAGDYL